MMSYGTKTKTVVLDSRISHQYTHKHKIQTKSYNDYLGVEEAGKDLILYTAGNDDLALLKKQYIDFGNLTVLSMINHLQ
jgi:hypothetical protein